MRISRGMPVAGVTALALVLVLAVATIGGGSADAAPQTATSAEGTILNAGSGTCTADFVVKDTAGKGIYDAKIEIQVRYGGLGLRHIDGTVGTNSDGKAHIDGLPEQIKKTATFTISHGGESKTVPYDPVADCHPHHEVVLDAK